MKQTKFVSKCPLDLTLPFSFQGGAVKKVPRTLSAFGILGGRCELALDDLPAFIFLGRR